VRLRRRLLRHDPERSPAIPGRGHQAPRARVGQTVAEAPCLGRAQTRVELPAVFQESFSRQRSMY